MNESPALSMFTEEGLLPPGDYLLTLDELRASLLVLGPGGARPNWDSGWALTAGGQPHGERADPSRGSGAVRQSAQDGRHDRNRNRFSR